MKFLWAIGPVQVIGLKCGGCVFTVGLTCLALDLHIFHSTRPLVLDSTIPAQLKSENTQSGAQKAQFLSLIASLWSYARWLEVASLGSQRGLQAK